MKCGELLWLLLISLVYMCDVQVHPAHEMAHLFLRAGQGRGPS